MVKVPSYDNYAITSLDTDKAYSRTQASPEAFGASVGQGMQALGAGIQKASDATLDIYKRIALTNVDNKYNETSDLFRQADKDYNQALGKNAIDGYAGAVQRLNDISQQTLDSISDPYERENMEGLLKKRIQQSVDAYDRHQSRQLEVYDEATYQGYLGTMKQGAIDNYNDPQTADWYLKTALTEVEHQGIKKGMPLEWVQNQQREVKEGIYSDIATVMLSEDPYKALSFLSDKQGDISPAIYAKVRKQAEPYITDAITQSLINQSSTGTVPVGGSQGMTNALFQVKKPPAQPPANISAILDDRAKAYGVDPALVRAVSYKESVYKVDALSPKGAMGLMQLMPDTARWLGLKDSDFYDPHKNVDAGVRYLSFLLDRYHGNQALALAGYNAGQGNVDKAIKKAGAGASIDEILSKLPKPSETVPYVKDILRGIAKGSEADPAQNASNVTNLDANVQTSTDNVRSSSNVINTPMSSSFMATGGYKTMDELNKWYSNVITLPDKMTNNPKQAMDVRSGLTAFYNQQKGFINQQMKASNDFILSDINNDRLNGVPIDFNKKRQNSQWAMNFDNMSPEGKNQVISSIKDQEKEQRQDYKDQSENKKYGIIGLLGNSRDAWNSFDYMAVEGLTLKDRDDLRKRHDEVLKNDDEKDGLMFKNMQRGTNIFNNEYQISTNATLSDNANKNAEYYKSLGRFQSLLRDAIKLNGGKPLTETEQRDLAMSSLKSDFQSFSLGQDNTLQTDYHFFGKPTQKMNSAKNIGQLVDEYTGKGGILEGENKVDVLKRIQDTANEGLPVNPLDIKKALQGK